MTILNNIKTTLGNEMRKMNRLQYNIILIGAMYIIIRLIDFR